MLKFLFFLKMFLIIIFLQGCSTTEPIKIMSQCVEKTPLEIINTEKLNLKKINWIIITENNYSEVFKKLKENNQNAVIFGLTDDGYKGLSINYFELLNYISSQKLIIKSYKDYYE